MANRRPIKSVGLCLKPGSSEAGEVARTLERWLTERGVEVQLDAEARHPLGADGRSREDHASHADLLVVLGGDGTLLAAAREAGTGEVPILGVNLGTLGFLAEVAPEELFEVLEKVLEGEFETVARMRLRVIARRGDEVLADALALNDAVITRSELSRMIDLRTLADGVPVATYHGDGLIVSTPTGSTAYTLSAGGPILMPGSRVYVLTPICPHTLTQRPLVLGESTGIEIRVFPRDGTAQLTIDGQIGVNLQAGDVVRIGVSSHPARFVVSPFRSRFDVLRAKLHWGAD